jgi:hypothetical protein
MTWRVALLMELQPAMSPDFNMYESSVMFAKSLGDVVPRMRKGIGMKKNMVIISLSTKSC